MCAGNTQMCVRAKQVRAHVRPASLATRASAGAGAAGIGQGGDPALSGAKKAGGWPGLRLGLRESGAGARLPTPKFKMWVQKENFVKTFGQNFRSKRFGQNVSVKTFRSKLIGTQALNNFYKP